MRNKYQHARNKPRCVGRFPSHYAGRYVSRSPLSPHFYIQKTYSPNKNKKHLRLVPIPTFPPAIQYRKCIFSVFIPASLAYTALQTLLYLLYSLSCALLCPALPSMPVCALICVAGSGPQGGGWPSAGESSPAQK